MIVGKPDPRDAELSGLRGEVESLTTLLAMDKPFRLKMAEELDTARKEAQRFHDMLTSEQRDPNIRYRAMIDAALLERDTARAEVEKLRADLAAVQKVVGAANVLANRVFAVLWKCRGIDTSHGGIADELLPLADAVLTRKGSGK